MKKIKSFLFVIACATTLFSCKDEKTIKETEPTIDSIANETPSTATDSITELQSFAEGTTDEAIAGQIKNFLTNVFLKDDLANLTENDRKFQFQVIDLNNDGKNEIFINFISSYFCGSGGCSILLIDSNWKTITYFSVTSTPLWIEKKGVNEWATIMVKSQGEFKELENKNGKYPSNPSVLPKSKNDAPSGSAQLIFSDDFAPAKTFTF
jgi:hypothetical protein